MIQPGSILIGFCFAGSISIISKKLKLLTLDGAIAALFVGTAVFACGGSNLTCAMIWFFITSNLLGKFRRLRKQGLGYIKPGARDAVQVLANGGSVAVFAIAAIFVHQFADQLRIAALSSVACAISDTWATEVGSAFSGVTILITSFSRVRAGRSGGISMPGSLAAALGSFSICAIAALTDVHKLSACWRILACGIFGCLFDSLLGATIQAQYKNSSGDIIETRDEHIVERRGIKWVTNDVVNFLATTASGLLALVIANLEPK